MGSVIMASPASPLHLAVALDGAGWHPAAWRSPRARPGELLQAGYWTETIQQAERGLIDFVTIEDSFGPDAQPDPSGPGPGPGSGASGSSGPGSDPSGPGPGPGPGGLGLGLGFGLGGRGAGGHGLGAGGLGRVRGHLDAVLIAARVAPLTSHIGLVPTVVVTHTEPFHISKAIATLDYVSTGRAGLRARVSASPQEAAHFGRRAFPLLEPGDYSSPQAQLLAAGLIEEAADYIEVVRRLWDSWEDDAVIRDSATGRFVDRDKLHYIDFRGGYFSVKGPSITPRPPQGQPPVSVLAHNSLTYRLAAQSADIAYVTPRHAAQAKAIVEEIREAQAAVGRAEQTVHVFADLVVFLDARAQAAAGRKAALDDLAGAEYTSDATVFTGTPLGLADLMEEWQASGVTGFRLRPGSVGDDVPAVTGALVPELQRRGLFRTVYEARTLRGLLELPRPASRFEDPVLRTART
jgi:alkanesulfonate monooxygenase SsuD/methylene tetrahydromethanopterin reductase-like flavin-dependent oxidoreductase (luciferase family)